jgi:hypothetical protein
MEAYQTERGRREDLELALVEINPYLGAIGTLILPMKDVAGKSGTYYYQDIEADSTAETSRGASAAPNEVVIGENSSTWSCSERIKRYVVRRDSVKTQFGTVARADMVGAKAALRSVLRFHEAEVAAAVLANATATVDDIEASFIQTAQAGLDAIKRYSGKKALVMSQTVFHRVMRYEEIVDRFGLSSAAVSGADALSIVAREPEALKLLLRAIIGVDEVLVGDDDIWYDGSAAYQERAALVALPDPDDVSELEGAVFGKTFRYLPDGQAYPFFIESHYDDDDKTNKYDASVWTSLEVMNTGALYILDGLDESNTVVTTTTTTV